VPSPFARLHQFAPNPTALLFSLSLIDRTVTLAILETTNEQKKNAAIFSGRERAEPGLRDQWDIWVEVIHEGFPI
jgi:hypothetical protein